MKPLKILKSKTTRGLAKGLMKKMWKMTVGGDSEGAAALEVADEAYESDGHVQEDSGAHASAADDHDSVRWWLKSKTAKGLMKRMWRMINKADLGGDSEGAA